MSHVLPVPKTVKDLFDDLLGRGAEVEPLDVEDLGGKAQGLGHQDSPVSVSGP